MQEVELTVADVMTTRLVTLTLRQHVLDGIDRLLQNEISGAPIVDDDGHLLGMFSEKSCINAFVVIDSERRRRCDESLQFVRAKDCMQTSLVTVRPDCDVFDAMNMLLTNRVSGLPVIDHSGQFRGVFSERSAMRVLIDLTWNQMSRGPVSAWMDSDRARTVTEQTLLPEMRTKFSETHYRRLPVLNHGRLVGQISRRDVLRADLNGLINNYQCSPGSLKFPEWFSPAPRQRWCVDNFALKHVSTVGPDYDLMSVAQEFFLTSARRFPVITNGKLIGQISRRDLLRSVQYLFPRDKPAQSPLYLSAGTGDVTTVLK
ncbi:MAG: CBS domain-containing protein [Rhodopirellula sp.]|nr:CBS domain-containing protein [Rhodopirellula sp.]